MASILFVYARTSIQAAKRNAKQHREADGGQINWHNESLRRHGRLEKPVEGGIVGELAGMCFSPLVVERAGGKQMMETWDGRWQLTVYRAREREECADVGGDE